MLGVPLMSHMYMYTDVDAQPGPDRLGVAHTVENENKSETVSLPIIITLCDPSICVEASQLCFVFGSLC